jgi:hypothetical protein
MSCCVFFNFKFFLRFLLLLIVGVIFWPNYVTRNTYAKYESELCIDIAESCSPPLPGAAAKK